MEDDLLNGVLLFILFRDEGVVVAHSDFVLLGAVSISAHRNGGMREHRLLRERREKVLRAKCIHWWYINSE